MMCTCSSCLLKCLMCNCPALISNAFPTSVLSRAPFFFTLSSHHFKPNLLSLIPKSLAFLLSFSVVFVWVSVILSHLIQFSNEISTLKTDTLHFIIEMPLSISVHFVDVYSNCNHQFQRFQTKTYQIWEHSVHFQIFRLCTE